MCVSAIPIGGTSDAPLENHPVDARLEPSALEGGISEILCYDPKGRRAFLRILCTEWRGVLVCWAHSKP